MILTEMTSYSTAVSWHVSWRLTISKLTGQQQLSSKEKITQWKKSWSLLYAFFWVIPWRINFICQCFGTLCLFHLHRRVGMENGWGWEMLGYLYGKRFGSKVGWAQAIFEPYLFPYKYPNISQPQSFFTPTHLWRCNRQRVPKRRHIKFRRWRITRKKANNIQNTAKVWNEDYWGC